MRAHSATVAGVLGIAATVLLLPAAEAQPEGPPRLSPMSTVSQVVGVARVAITYSRPAVSGREIWGGLVPWDEVWRTGANEATRLELSDDAQIDGEPLAAGAYSVFTIPSPEEWTVIFNREADQWGAFQHDPARDALRIRVRPRPAEFQERFLIYFPSVGADSATVALRWERVEVPFEVTFDLDRIVVRKAREFVARSTPADGQMVWRWANYLYQNDLGTDEALVWAGDLAEAAPMYWTHALHARLLALHERREEAIEAARKALGRVGEESDQPGVEADAVTLVEEMDGWRSAEPPTG